MEKRDKSMPVTESSKRVGSQWRTISESERKRYEDLSAKERKEYEQQMDKYHKAAPAPPKLIRNALNAYVSEHHKGGDITEVVRGWSKLSDAEKEAYAKKAKEMNTQRINELKKWRQSHADAIAIAETIKDKYPVFRTSKAYLEHAQMNDQQGPNGLFSAFKDRRHSLLANMKDAWQEKVDKVKEHNDTVQERKKERKLEGKAPLKSMAKKTLPKRKEGESFRKLPVLSPEHLSSEELEKVEDALKTHNTRNNRLRRKKAAEAGVLHALHDDAVLPAA